MTGTQPEMACHCLTTCFTVNSSCWYSYTHLKRSLISTWKNVWRLHHWYPSSCKIGWIITLSKDITINFVVSQFMVLISIQWAVGLIMSIMKILWIFVFFSILKTLLWEMIDRSMMGSMHPKLLFRRYVGWNQT